MRFLERSKTQHITSARGWPAGQEWPTRQDSTRRDLPSNKEHSRQDSTTARPSTSSVTSTQLKRRSSLPLRADVIGLQAGPRIRLRPNTAEGDDKARVSFFEAFKIDAGEDFFAFPKPSSTGKTPPLSDVDISSPVASPGPPSPLIGIAIGSPSHPTTEWTTLMPASAKSSIMSPRMLAWQHSPLLAPSPLQTSFDTQPSQEAVESAGPEIGDRKKSSWKKIFRRPSKPAKSNSSPVTMTPTVVSPDSSTAIRNKPQRLRSSSRALERIDLEARLSASSSPPAKSNTFASTNPLALNPPTPKFANVPTSAAAAPPFQPRGRQPVQAPQMVIDKSANSKPSQQLPAAPSPPAKELPAQPNINRTINNRPTAATGLAVPRLNLTLPSYQMERYSVMFEGVLDAKPSSAPPTTERYQSPFSKSPTTSPIQASPQSALLERRKSRLRMLDVPSSNRPVPLQDQTQLSAITPVKSAALPTRKLKSEAFHPRHQPLRSGQAISTRSRSSSRPKVFHKPLPLHRSNTSPLPKPSPMRTYFTNLNKRQDSVPHQTETFFDSPVSADDEDMSFPDTPPPMSTSPSMLSDVRVVTDYSLPSVTTESSDKDNLSTVWHSVLPAAPASSTSSRFSIDIHRAMESPDAPLSRSKSTDTTATRAFIHKVQVATARRINMSRSRHDAVQSAGLSKQPLRPMLVNVNSSSAHSRETSMQDTFSPISA